MALFGGLGGSGLNTQINFRMSTRSVVKTATITNMQLKNMSTTARRTARNLSLVSNSLDTLHTKGVQASASLAGVGFTMFALGRKIATGFTKQAIDNAADFEVAMERIRFATGATGGELKRLERVMIDLGLKTVETPTSAANAFADLRAAGIKTNEALELLPMTIQMVTGSRGVLGMSEAIRVSVSAITKFKHTGQSFRKTMDDIAQATRETALNWEHMPAFFNALRAAPMKLKATSGEILALGGVMRLGGAQAAEAGQAIGIFTEKMISNSRRLRIFAAKKGMTEEEFLGMDVKDLPMRLAQFQEFGKSIKMFDEAGKLKPVKTMLVDILKQMEHLQSIGDEKALTSLSGAFGDKAGTMVQMLTQLRKNNRSVSESLEELFGKFKKTTGVLKQAEDAFLKTAKGVEKLREGTEQTLLIVFGQTMLPLFDKLSRALLNVMNIFLAFLEKNRMFAKALSYTVTVFGFLAIAAGAAALGLAGVLFYTFMLGPALASVGGIAGAAAMGFAALKASMLPILIVSAGLLALFGLLYLAFAKFDEGSFKNSFFLSRLFGWIKDVKLVVQGLIEWWNGKGGPNSMELFTQLNKRKLTGIVGYILQLKTRLVAIFKGIWKVLSAVGYAIGMMLYIGILMPLGLVIDAFRAMARAVGTDDLTNTIDVYRMFGYVLGVVMVLAAGAFAAKLIKMITLTALAAKQMLILKAATLGYAAVAIAYFVVLGIAIMQAIQLGDKFGNWLAVDMKKKFREGLIYAKEFGKGFVEHIKKGIAGDWPAMVEWLINQFEYLKVSVLSWFDIATQQDVDAAFKKATGRDFTTTERDRIEYGDEFIDRRSEQKAAISEQAALSRAGFYGGVQQSGVAGPEPWEKALAESKATSERMDDRQPPMLNVTINGNVNNREDAEYMVKEFYSRSTQMMDKEWEIGFK